MVCWNGQLEERIVDVTIWLKQKRTLKQCTSDCADDNERNVRKRPSQVTGSSDLSAWAKLIKQSGSFGRNKRNNWKLVTCAGSRSLLIRPQARKWRNLDAQFGLIRVVNLNLNWLKTRQTQNAGVSRRSGDMISRNALWFGT
jgi:hypothetical protein